MHKWKSMYNSYWKHWRDYEILWRVQIVDVHENIIDAKLQTIVMTPMSLIQNHSRKRVKEDSF